MKKSESGIAHIATILIILFVAVAGFAGWRVYQSSKDKPKEPATVSEEISTVVQNEEKSPTPAGFVEYENKDIGIKFSYPKEWGTVQIKKEIGDGVAIQGTNVSISFSDNKQPAATLRSRDYKILTGGRGGAYWDAPTEFKIRKEVIDGQEIIHGVSVSDVPWNQDQEYASKVILDQENLKIIAGCSGFTASVAIHAYPYLKSNNLFDTGNFYFLIRGPSSDGTGVDLTGCDNLEKLIANDKDRFIKFAQTISVI